MSQAPLMGAYIPRDVSDRVSGDQTVTARDRVPWIDLRSHPDAEKAYLPASVRGVVLP